MDLEAEAVEAGHVSRERSGSTKLMPAVLGGVAACVEVRLEHAAV